MTQENQGKSSSVLNVLCTSLEYLWIAQLRKSSTVPVAVKYNSDGYSAKNSVQSSQTAECFVEQDPEEDRTGIASSISSDFLQHQALELMVALSMTVQCYRWFFYFDTWETRMNLTSPFCSSANTASGE